MEILKALWEMGPSSVREVLVKLNREVQESEKLAYNTVQTLLRIMDEKGLVAHEVRGRGFVYTPRYMIRPDFLLGSLFVREKTRHYYFGDYFEPRYRKAYVP